jgi:phosphohistidine phosphatase SixA
MGYRIALALLTLSQLWAARASGGPITIDDLKAGGFVLFFRHTARDLEPPPPAPPLHVLDNAGKCTPGSELNQRGLEEAKRTAEKIRALSIPVSKIYASPTCRTRQMGEILAGEPVETKRELAYPAMAAYPGEEVLNLKLLKVLLADAPQNGNRILISHLYTIHGLPELGASFLLDQGDAAVFESCGELCYRFLNVIPRAEWLK